MAKFSQLGVVELAALGKKAQSLSEWDEPRGVAVWLRQVSPHQSTSQEGGRSHGRQVWWGEEWRAVKTGLQRAQHTSTKVTWHLLSREMTPTAQIHSAGGSSCFSLYCPWPLPTCTHQSQQEGDGWAQVRSRGA